MDKDEVEKKREEYGWNELDKEEGTPLWKLVLEQFDDTLVKILLAAAVASAFPALGRLGGPVVLALGLLLGARSLLLCRKSGCSSSSSSAPSSTGRETAERWA